MPSFLYINYRLMSIHHACRTYLTAFVLLALIASGTEAVAAVKAQKSPRTAWAVRIADNFLRLHPDSIAYSSEGKGNRWNYEQGLMLEGFYRMWLRTHNEKYFSYVKKNLDHYVREDGSIATYRFTEYQLDNLTPGRTLIEVLEKTKDAKYRIAIDTLRKQLGVQPRTSEGGFWHKNMYPHQMWLDGLYMGAPFYAQYAAAFGEPKAYDDIARQFLIVAAHMRDSSTGLFYHGWDESKQQKWANPRTGCSPNFWGRAMGWYMMGLADVLDYFPKAHPQRPALLAIFKTLARDLAKYRDPKTGLWSQIVNQPLRTGNYVEASVSTMVTYAYAKGANEGWLNARYKTLAQESFDGILKTLVTIDTDSTITLNHVCSVAGLGGNPYRDGSFEYYVGEAQRKNDFKGYGPFLLAAIELERSTKH
jgi:unsaturated rhamnogalacturonyl hydrolase